MISIWASDSYSSSGIGRNAKACFQLAFAFFIATPGFSSCRDCFIIVRYLDATSYTMPDCSLKKTLLAIMLLAWVLPGEGKIYYSKKEALNLAFGQGAKVELLSLFPDKNQIRQIEQLARVKMKSALVSFYTGKRDGKLLGYAAIESQTVRTKPETLMVVLTPKGQISAIHTLAFHEPPEYQPPPRWYAQLYRRDLPELAFNADVQGMTGATLSARSGLNIARQVMAAFDVLIKDKHN